MKYWMILIILLVTQAAQADEDVPEQHLRLDIGFAHWFSDSFRSADQGKNLSIGIGYRTPIDWLEIGARYEWATIKLDTGSAYYPEYNGKRVNFFTFGPAYKKDFTVNGQTLTLKLMILNLLYVDIADHKGAYGESNGFEVEWLFDNTRGMIFNFREQGYKLPTVPLGIEKRQVDAMVTMGYVNRF